MACDAPGLKKEDIDIQFEDNILTVKAERKEEAKEEVSTVVRLWRWGGWSPPHCAHTSPQHKQNDRWHVNERRWGSVSRSVRLPKSSDASNISAKYEVRKRVCLCSTPGQ